MCEDHDIGRRVRDGTGAPDFVYLPVEIPGGASEIRVGYTYDKPAVPAGAGQGPGPRPVPRRLPSALLVLGRSESAALRTWLSEHRAWSGWPAIWHASRFTSSTLRRAAAALPRAVTALKGVHLIPLGDRVVTKAMSVGDSALRSIDALHLSSAMLLKPRLTHFVVYDKRLYDAAQAEGLHPMRPGA